MTSPPRHGGETAIGTAKRSRGVFLWRVQRATEKLFHSRNQILSRIHRRNWRFECFVKLHVSLHRFTCGDFALRSDRFVFHSLRTESTNPTPFIPLAHSTDVRWSTLLCQSTTLAFYRLHVDDLSVVLRHRNRLLDACDHLRHFRRHCWFCSSRHRNSESTRSARYFCKNIKSTI